MSRDPDARKQAKPVGSLMVPRLRSHLRAMRSTRRRVLGGLAVGTMAKPAAAQANRAAFEPIATLRSAASGAQFLTPIGIPFAFGRVAAADLPRLRARYPARPDGALLPLQIEQPRIRGDGTLMHCTGHLALPAGYVARDPVQIGIAAAPPPMPAPPDWRAITASGADIVVTLSIWTPRVHWLALDRAPVTGDAIAVTFEDAQGRLDYARRFVAAHDWKTAHDAGRAVFDHLAKAITQDPNGRYRCYAPRNLPRREGRAGEANDDHFHPKYGNAVVINDLGHAFGFAAEAEELGPRRNARGATGSDRWAPQAGRHGLYLWPRWRAGDPEPYRVRVQITRAPGSQLAFLADRRGTRATDGWLEPVDDPAPRRRWQASFASAAATRDSPWFDGALVHQIERCAAFHADGERHPHLEAWFRVSWDRQGRIVDRQVTIENTRFFAAARDYSYDAEITVDGLVRTMAQPERWRDLYHGAWETWRWAEAKPVAMCDAADFMRARLVFPWTRFPDADHSAEMACKLRGSAIDWERNATDARPGARPAVRATLNDPLYAGAWCFTGQGGARAELGVFSSWEWWFWTGDTLSAWPSLEAQADNVFGAFGFQVRDDSAGGDATGPTPDLYRQWDVAPHHRTSLRFGNPFGRPQQPDARFQPVSQLHLLKRPFHPANSHLPSSGIYSAYLVRPEKCFFDKQEQYAWFAFLKTQSQNTLTAPHPGGVPGDAAHVIGYQVANGERSYAWPMREILRTAFLKFASHRRRAYWRRVAQDQANHFNLLCTRTIWGAFHVRNLFNPDSGTWRSVPPLLPAGSARGPSPGHSAGFARLDAVKSGYVNLCAMHGMDLDAADFAPGIQVNLWQLHALDAAPPGQWFRLLGAAGPAIALCRDLVRGPGESFVSASGDWPIWSRDDMRDLHAWLEMQAGDPVHARLLRLPRSIADLDRDLREVGYSYVKQHQAGLYMLERYHPDPAIRAAARRWIARIDAAWPGAARVPVGGDRAYPLAKLFQQLGLIPEDRIA
jgi:hypothetical protein